MAYLSYGPYGSFGPTYDSSLSNITKEESDELLETYGSDVGLHYSKRYAYHIPKPVIISLNVMHFFTVKLYISASI